jgi:hypothetical protein
LDDLVAFDDLDDPPLQMNSKMVPKVKKPDDKKIKKAKHSSVSRLLAL